MRLRGDDEAGRVHKSRRYRSRVKEKRQRIVLARVYTSRAVNGLKERRRYRVEEARHFKGIPTSPARPRGAISVRKYCL